MILDRIVAQTRNDLEQRKNEIPLAEIQERAATQPVPRDALATLRSDGRVHLIAEIKRASPSKGLLMPNFDPVALARTYEANGASLVSVLTEPHFFQGAPGYMTAVKASIALPVLCKDFIFDEYQVYEARSWGADLLLLICALLDDVQLLRLLTLAHSLGMHCLVETHNAEEVRRAVTAGAQIIGVNSRDLKTFEMHTGLLRELRPLIPADRVVVAESGIHNAADARRLARYSIGAMLVGEALVTSQDTPARMRELVRGANSDVQVKVCGLSSESHFLVANEAGADLVGLVFYEPSHRYVTPRSAQELAQTCGLARSGMETVGVFVNREASYINDVAEQVGLHIVQLHGDEQPEFCQHITRPVIKALHVNDLNDLDKLNAYRETTWRLLLDTPTPHWGGSGNTHDWRIAHTAARQTRVLLAGGLTSTNVTEAIAQVHPWGVDVSSGVETNKRKDEAKIRAFVEHARKTV